MKNVAISQGYDSSTQLRPPPRPPGAPTRSPTDDDVAEAFADCRAAVEIDEKPPAERARVMADIERRSAHRSGSVAAIKAPGR